jgi:hypothetical protein
MNIKEYEKLMSLSKSQFNSRAYSRKGIKLTEEHKRKISISNIGRVISEETREKLSIANKGNKPTAYARKLASKIHKDMPKSKQHRMKIGKGNSKQVRTPKGIYDSLNTAAAVCNISTVTLNKLLKKPNSGFSYVKESLRRIRTPKGVFNNINDIAEAFNVRKGTVHDWLKKDKDNFMRVT